eukprot:7824082-Alexandrium_andersonii.AAC.1
MPEGRPGRGLRAPPPPLPLRQHRRTQRPRGSARERLARLRAHRLSGRGPRRGRLGRASSLGRGRQHWRPPGRAGPTTRPR